MNGALMPSTPQRAGLKLQHAVRASHLRWSHCTHSLPTMPRWGATRGLHSIKRSSKVKLVAAHGGCRSQIQGCYHLPTATTTLHQVLTTILAVAINSTLPGTCPVHASAQAS